MTEGYYHVLFSRMPDAPNGDTQFIEVNDIYGVGVMCDWIEKDDHVELVIPSHPGVAPLAQQVRDLKKANVELTKTLDKIQKRAFFARPEEIVNYCLSALSMYGDADYITRNARNGDY